MPFVTFSPFWHVSPGITAFEVAQAMRCFGKIQPNHLILNFNSMQELAMISSFQVYENPFKLKITIFCDESSDMKHLVNISDEIDVVVLTSCDSLTDRSGLAKIVEICTCAGSSYGKRRDRDAVL